jgi:phosphatidylglycerophosphatase C
MKPARHPAVAAFDLDGTITKGSSFWRFLLFCRGPGRVARAAARRLLLVSAGSLMPSLFGGRAKAYLVASLLSPLSDEALSRLAADFAKSLVMRRARAHVLSQLAWHKDRGDTVVLVSASPAIYVRPIAELIGADGVIATEYERDRTGRLVPATPNTRGRQKVARLAELLSSTEAGVGAFLYAYGNSRNDHPMLRSANLGVDVSRCQILPRGDLACSHSGGL